MKISSKVLSMDVQVSPDMVQSLHVCNVTCLNCLNYDASTNTCNACSLRINFPTYVESGLVDVLCDESGSVDVLVDSIGEYVENGTPESFVKMRKILEDEKKKKS